MDANAWDQVYRDKDLVWSAEANRFVAESLAELAPARALDMAAGEGRNAIWLAKHGWQVHAIDFSSAAIDKARALAAKHAVDVEWEVADLLEVELPADSYELVLISYLHLGSGDMAAVLAKAASALAPNGTFFLIGHAARNLREGVGGPQDASVLYGVADVTKHLPTLRIDRAEEVLRSVEKEGQTHQAIDVLVRATKAIEASTGDASS